MSRLLQLRPRADPPLAVSLPRGAPLLDRHHSIDDGADPGDVPITVAFTGAAVFAALVAGGVATRPDTVGLRRWFAYLVFLVAAGIAVEVAVSLLG